LVKILLVVIALFSYRVTDESTTFIYEVTSGERPAISHVIFELCVVEGAVFGFYDPVNDVKTPMPVEVGLDPTTGIFGVKFDYDFDDNETRYYYIELPGFWSLLETNVAVKSGLVVDYVVVEGPVCRPTALTISGLSQVFDAGLISFFIGVVLCLMVGTLLMIRKRI
jgi:hypothetical protein